MNERHRFGHLRSCLLATALTAFPLAAQAGGALPAGGNYVAGKGTITGAGGGLTINQASTAGIIDWSSFSIGQGNSVQFNNGSGATLNRVTGGDMARIGGSLSATGSIFLIDPQGVVISNTGKVVTGESFVGSTRDISNSDFMSGTMRFRGSSSGNVVNHGQIRSNGGDAVLIGNSVQNTGTLSAPKGTAGMAAGNDVLLQPVGGDQRVFVKGGKGDVRNSGTISAATAELRAANGNVYALSGNNGGIINATGTQIINGHVWLTSNTGKVTVNGNISAKNTNGAGGAVTVRGSNIDVSGHIDASATAAGRNGGDVSIIATQTTNVGGIIKAAGGQGAKGGFVETSGAHLHVADSASINTLSLGGASGTWLIDPNDFTIAASGGDITGATLSANLLNTDVSISSDDGATAGHGDIFVNDAVSWSSAHTLTLTALRNIEINAGITVGGAGTLDLTAANAIAINHTVQVTGAGAVNLSAGLDTTTIPGASLLQLSFANGASIDYGAIDNGGTLSINTTPYTLLYKLADGANTAPDSGTDDIAGIDATDDSGYYALATNLDGTGTTFTSALAGAGANLFSGTFEGLGNTITGLTINDTTNGHNVGLFGKTSAATIRDIGLIGGSVTAGINSSAGGLVGENFGGSSVAIIANAYDTGSVLSDHFTGGYHGVGGLVGLNHAGSGRVAAIVNSYATGATTGIGFANVGGLLGFNYADGGTATVTQSFATGNAQGGDSANVGGLVGATIGGSLSNVYATGSVTGGDGGAWTGGLVGYNSGGGSVSDAYATGAVTTGADSGSAGGFVGFSDSGTITDAYATGAVSVGSSSTGGGFAGYSGGTVTNAYWDSLTSGQSSDGAQATGSGSINGFDPATGSIGLTTAQLQGLQGVSGNTLFDVSTAFSNPLWGGGSAGLYPYLSFQFPTGTPQAIGGIAYSDAGLTPLGAGNTVSAFMNGAVLNSALTGGTVTTGANGYYYYLLAPGALDNSQVLTTTTSGAALGEDTSKTLSNFNIFGGALNDFTSVDSYATELSERAANLATAEGSNPSLASFVAGLSGFYLTSTAPSFSIDTAPDLSSDIFISDNATGGVITVDAPISWGSANALTLGAHEIDINAKITIAGAGALTLNTCGCFNYKFGSGGSIDYGTVDHGGSFTADGTSYTLLYNMADVQAINADDTSLQGNYALATSLDATSTSGWIPIGTDGLGVAGNGGVGFAGEFAGLGNTISNLTVDIGLHDYSGVFGYSQGTIRDFGLIGGSTTGRTGVGGIVGFNSGGTLSSVYYTGSVLGLAAVGGVGGLNTGTVTNSYATGQITGFNYVGGLLGETTGGATISNSYATGDVTGVMDSVMNTLLPGSSASGTPFAVGGLIGTVDSGTITDSYATGSVTADNGEGIGGLIGSTNGSGQVTVTNAHATGNVTADAVSGQGGVGVGGLIGENAGEVTNSYATGDVLGEFRIGGLVGANSNDTVGNDGNLTNVYATGSVSAPIDVSIGLYGNDVGGLVGDNSGTILNAFATGDVSGGQYVGGFVGFNEGATSISEADASGNVTSPYNAGGTGTQIGGFAGENDGDILDAYALGSVTGADQVGGFVGQNGGGTVTNAYSIGAVNLATGAPTPTQMGGFAGYNQGTVTAGFYDTDFNPLLSGIGDGNLVGVTGLTTAQFFDSANLTGFTFDTTAGGPGWVIIDDDGSFNNASGSGATMPLLLMENSSIITNAHQLQMIALDLAGDYTLANDIDLSKTNPTNGQDVWGPAGFVPIGTIADFFTGTFEGNNHTLDGLTINSTVDASFAGLFSVNGGTIQNLHLTNVALSQLGLSAYLGGIAGGNGGTILNTTVSGTLTGGDFSGVGGITGLNVALVSSSSSTANVSAGDSSAAGGLVAVNLGGILQSHATGALDVTGGDEVVGGLVGENDGLISDSYATGQVTVTNTVLLTNANDVGGLVGDNSGGGDISSSYATGAVIATGDNADAGGLVGFQCSCSTIEQSYASGAVSVTGDFAIAGGLVGENEGDITQSYADGSVNVIGDSADAGGFVGDHDVGTILQSYATASVYVTGDNAYAGGFVGNNLTDGVVDQSYATGLVTVTGATPLTGGFAAENDGVIHKSYWDQDSTGQGATGIGNDTGAGTTLVGLTSSTAFTRSNYGALGSFSTVWYMVNGQTRPFLRWEYSTDITNAHQLQLMSMDLTASYTLANDIDLGSPLSDASQMWSSAGFAPIGTSSLFFTGQFDGQNHTVDGLMINMPTMDRVGLFRGACACATISNVNLTNVDITGRNYVGAITGYNAGDISGVSEDGSVSGAAYIGGLAGYNYLGATIDTSSSGGTVTATGNHAGGLVAYNAGSITQSASTADVGGVSVLGGLIGYNSADGLIDGSTASGSVTATGDTVGGLVGTNLGTIQNLSSYTGGTVSGVANVGGLVGYNLSGGIIDDSTASGTVTSTGNAAGGLVGTNLGTIRNLSSFTSGSVSGAANVGGLVGYNGSGGSIADSSANGTISGAFIVGGLVGYNVSGATIDTSSSSGTVSTTDNRAGGLVAYNAGSITQSSSTADVSGVSVLGGLVGYNLSGGIIDDSTASGSVTATGNAAGGLVGINYGMIRNLSSYTGGSVSGAADVGGLAGYNGSGGSIADSSASGTISGTSTVGGLVGYNVSGATISTSSSSGTVSTTGNRAGGLVAYNAGSITQSESAVDVSGVSVIGGLTGRNSGSISQAYAMGSVTSTGRFAGGLIGYNTSLGTVDQAYATGPVSGIGFVGGLVGANAASSGAFTSVYWDSDTAGTAIGVGKGDSTGITPLTTAQFKSGLPSGFLIADWAESSIINSGFPYLLALQ